MCIQWIQHFAHTELWDYNSVRSLLFSQDNEPIGYAVDKPKDHPNGSKPWTTKHKSYQSCIPTYSKPQTTKHKSYWYCISTYLLSLQYDSALQDDVNGDLYFDAPEDIDSDLDKYGCYINFENVTFSDNDPLSVYWDLGQGSALKNNHNNATIMHIIVQDILQVHFWKMMIIVLQQDRNNIKIIQYTHSKTREKQRSISNCDSNRPNHIKSIESNDNCESSKDSSKVDNESNKSDCSFDKCVLYAHKPIKFNGELNRLDCAIDANAHTAHNPTGNFIHRNTGMNMIQVKELTSTEQDGFINPVSWHTIWVNNEAQVKNTSNVQRFLIAHHTPKAFSIDIERSPPLTLLSGSHGQFFPSYGERCQSISIHFHIAGIINISHIPSKYNLTNILSKHWSHQASYENLVKPLLHFHGDAMISLLILLTYLTHTTWLHRYSTWGRMWYCIVQHRRLCIATWTYNGEW